MSFWNRGKGHAKREAKAAQAAYSKAQAAAEAQRKQFQQQELEERKKINEKQVRGLRRRSRVSGFSQQTVRSGVSEKLG